jgi:hypothetical protein
VDLHVDIELQGGILLVTRSGTVSFDAALRAFKQAVDTAKAKQVSKILVNTLAAKGELSTLDRYDIATGVVEQARQREMNPKIAIVGKPPTMDGFGVRVGQNRNMNAEAFSAQQPALNWLNRWPS